MQELKFSNSKSPLLLKTRLGAGRMVEMAGHQLGAQLRKPGAEGRPRLLPHSPAYASEPVAACGSQAMRVQALRMQAVSNYMFHDPPWVTLSGSLQVVPGDLTFKLNLRSQ